MKHNTPDTTPDITPDSATFPVIPGPTLAELQSNPVPDDFYQLTGPLPYRMINDALFHIVLEANPEVLKSLLCALLTLAPEQILSIEVTNPIELGSTIYNKNYVLDLKIRLNNNTLINIEVQVLKLKFWKERSLGYLCRTFDNLNKGDDYCNTRPAIQIGILDFEIFDGDTEFFATYHLANDITHKIYSDKFRLSVLQLNQVKHATDEDISSKRTLWAEFFKVSTWKEVSMLAEQDPIFAEAAKTIYRVTEDERVRNHCDAREMGERTHNTLVKQLAEQTQQLEEQKQQLEAKEQQLEEKEQQLEAKDLQLEEKEQQLEAKDALIAELKAALALSNKL